MGRVTLFFAPDVKESFLLSIGNPSLDIVDVYLLDNKNRILNSYLMGSNRKLADRPFNHRHFITPIDSQQQSVTIYIKVHSKGRLLIPVNISKQSSLAVTEQILMAVIGFISGGLALLSAYFLITYISMRSPIRFWFALSTACFALLFLNINGILGQITSITAYITQITVVLSGMLILTTAKVTFAILEKVPPLWRYVFYLIGSTMLVVAFILPYEEQVLLSLALSAFAISLIAVLAIFYYSPDKKTANIFAVIGLMLIALSASTQIYLFLNDIAVPQSQLFIIAVCIMLGILLIALAIDAHEKTLTHRHSQKQQLAISDLQRFYNLFRNSAEGLYTSTLEGKLISVNPAMCSLFGYQNEQQMLDSITNANEFYANPADRELLLGQILQNGKVIAKEIKGVKQDGSEFWFSISGQIKEELGQSYLFGSIFDITERKQSDISIEFMASHDPLTGVYNRREFEKRLNSALANIQQGNNELTLLYMDLDQFKVVNDTCGHKAGDLLISQLSQKINQVVTDKGIMARLGGDEFAVLLENDNSQVAYLLANQILNVVGEFRFFWENSIFTLGISIGQVSWQPNITSAEQILSMADAACYLAKERGRNQIHTYSQEDKHEQKHESELAWLNKINQAIDNNQLQLFYQHYQTLNKSNSGHHYEVLLRMQDEEGRLVAPALFLPSAERYNLTAQIDRWVTENYFRWLSNNPAHLAELAMVNLNLNGYSLSDKGLKLYILNAFEKYKIPHSKVCFQITESMAILKMDETLEFFKTFHKLGCKFSLDKFGSGFSSYVYLKKLPVDQVKIDGNYVKNILIDPVDMAMVSSIKDVTKTMGIETVAEYVESVDVMVALGKIGVDYAQGFGVAKPKPMQDFEALL
ncbi:EAL domain-containing protein [Paraglaciecola aquimarina]|uniref:EAL domain-containing protein n=1 Tax=Paraglaciecola aquimarina TaxID=1235557 RepID=A0ABU3SS97_9ALTE|nr:EAL domain-containing protein [Paraglaciecola aquimarina]MDU0352892.1 EAL domain-containing protein [Paraglaciecola aquimarina]